VSKEFISIALNITIHHFIHLSAGT